MAFKFPVGAFLLVVGLIFVTSATAIAQQITFEVGVRAGIPLTKVADEGSILPGVSQVEMHHPFIAVGPTLGLAIGDQLAVAVEGIYKPVRFQSTDESVTSIGFRTTRANSVEVPVTASYTFSGSSRRPFVRAGLVVYQKLWGRTESRRIFNDGRETNVVFPYEAPTPDASSMPFVLGGGLEVRRSILTIRPELRYTLWPGGLDRGINQLDILIGFTLDAFRASRNSP